MYRIDGSCVRSDILLKLLMQYGWTYKISPGKMKVVRFTKTFHSKENAAESRSLLHRRLHQHKIEATFNFIYWDKEAKA